MAGILPFFRGAAFDYDLTKAVGGAFDRACHCLHDSANPISCGKSSPGGSSKLPAGASAIPTSYARALQALGFGKRQIV
jgi:hypothetical protein